MWHGTRTPCHRECRAASGIIALKDYMKIKRPRA
jgi:hypothetical protein